MLRIGFMRSFRGLMWDFWRSLVRPSDLVGLSEMKREKSDLEF